MTDEKLIEEAAKAVRHVYQEVPPFGGLDWEGYARAAFAVFEKANAPSDDEREALADILDQHWWHEPTGACSCGHKYAKSRNGINPRDVRLHVAEAMLAAGFRRSEVPEPLDRSDSRQRAEYLAASKAEAAMGEPGVVAVSVSPVEQGDDDADR